MPDTELASDTQYYWRVRGHDFCGDSGWSEAQQFRTRLNPEAKVTPASLGFDLLQQSTATASLEIGNIGDDELNWNLTPAACAGSSPSAWLSVDPASGSVSAGQSGETLVTVDATGLDAGNYSSQLCLASNDHDQPQINIPVQVTVEQLSPGEFVLDPASVLAFADTPTGNAPTRSVTLSNVAAPDSAAVVLDSIGIVVDPMNAFSILTNGCDAELAPGQSCTIEVRFAPPAQTSYAGVLRISADGQTYDISLSGRGIEPPPIIFEDRFEE